MHFQVALGVCSQSVLAHARNLHFTSPEGEGFQPSPKETLKGAELLELQNRQLSLTLLSRNKDGHPEMEERSVASFYDFFLKLHDKRGKPHA
jgi:hypothetical protein